MMKHIGSIHPRQVNPLFGQFCIAALLVVAWTRMSWPNPLTSHSSPMPIPQQRRRTGRSSVTTTRTLG